MSDTQDTRTIIAVSKPFATSNDFSKQGEIHYTLSDGADAESGGIVERTENGAIVQRVELRTPNGLTDGPLYTPFVHDELVKLGCVVPAVGAVHDAIVLAPEPSAAPTPIAPTTAITIPALPPNATPAQHASRFHALLSALLGGLGVLAHGAGSVVDAGAAVAVSHPEVVAALAPKYGALITVVAAVEQAAHSTSTPSTPQS